MFNLRRGTPNQRLLFARTTSMMRFRLGLCPMVNCWIRFLRRQYFLEIQIRAANWMIYRVNVIQIALTSGTVVQAIASTIAGSRSLRPLLMTWCIQNDQREYIDVPHAIDAGEECRREFQMNGVIPAILSFDHLAHNETDDGQCRTYQCGQHQEFETINDSFVVQATCDRHWRQRWTFYADIAEYAPNHVTQKHEINARRNAGQDDEGKLWRRDE